MDSMLDSAAPPVVASAPDMGGARLYLDPEILALRAGAKLGGVPFRVTFSVEGRRDMLVLDAAGRQPSLEARRQGRDAADLRAWGSSEYADLDREDVLTKVRAKVCRVAVETVARGKATAAGEFGSWRAFTDWLADAPEEDAKLFVEIPRSLFRAAQKLGERRKRAAGRGTLREVVTAALAAYLEAHRE